MEDKIPHSKPTLGSDDIDVLRKQVETGFIAEGEKTKKLENKLKNIFNAEDAICVSSGSQALFLAIYLIDVSEKEKVIMPTYTCPSVLKAVQLAGAKPVASRIQKNYIMDPDDAQKKIDEGTGAVLFPFLFGIWADYSLHQFGVPVISDCAQLFDPNGEVVEEFPGDFVTLSFHATKLLTGGEGGALIIKNSDHIEMSKFESMGLRKTDSRNNCFPMSDLQSALVLNQIKKYQKFLKKRMTIAEVYNQHFREIHALKTPDNFLNDSIYFRYPIRYIGNDYNVREIISMFESHDITIRKPVEFLLHRKLGHGDNQFQTATELYNQTFSIPCYPSLKENEIQRIINITKKSFQADEQRYRG